MSNNVLHKVEPHRADPAADIVFVHGLGGDHLETWMANSDETYWPCWLAHDFDGVNVWSLAYPSSPTGWSGDGVEFDTILDSLLDYLTLAGIGQRPFILISHSLGGLVAKGLLRTAAEAGDPRLQSFASKLRGVAFLATPHSGSGLASFGVRFLSRIPLTRIQPILQSLCANGAQLEKLNDWYRNHSAEMGVKSLVYREGKRTGLVRVVSAASGHPGLANVSNPTINRDHFNVCKPPSRDDQVYLGVRRFIEDCLKSRADAAPPARPSPSRAEIDSAPNLSSTLPTPPPPSAQPPLPRAPRLFGRDEEVSELVTALLSDDDTPIAVLGQAGIGKSALTLTALQSAEVTARFGQRRWFVRLETATEARAVWTSILWAMGEEPDSQPDAQALALLATEPGLLVLDNGETPWYADKAGTEEALASLSAVPRLKVVVSIRGQQSPYGPVWRRIPQALDRLSHDDAKALFLSLAGRQLAEAPQLDALLEELDGLPLAIRLIGHLAQGEQSVAGLLRDYRERRTSLSIGEGKDQSLATSIQLSLDSSRLDDEARRLFIMMGRLPAGLADAHAEALIANGRAATLKLRQIGIATGDADSRTRLLAPIRQDAAGRLLSASDEATLARHYFGLATDEGAKIGAKGGHEATTQLRPEIANLENLARLAARTETGSTCAPMSEAALDGAYGLAELMRFTGIGTADTLRHIASIAKNSKAPILEANCIKWFGNIQLGRSNNDIARAAFEEALVIYRQEQDIIGKASCIKGLGDIAFASSEYQVAGEAYEEAMTLAREAGSKGGEANCIRSLGDIAQARSDYDAARDAYERALPLYREIGETLGEANCIQSLGHIAFARSDHPAARTAYGEALQLYRQIGDTLGEASCVRGLGMIALERSDYGAAQSAYEEALPLYRQVGNKVGEANCLQSLGSVALACNEYAAAQSACEEALLIYRSVGSKAGEAGCVESLGDIALYRADYDAARATLGEALLIYRQIDNKLGEANCLRSLGDVALAVSDRSACLAIYKEALALYVQIAEPYSIGMTHKLLARITDGKTRSGHVTAARRAWQSIERDDLIASLDKEFS